MLANVESVDYGRVHHHGRTQRQQDGNGTLSGRNQQSCYTGAIQTLNCLEISPIFSQNKVKDSFQVLGAVKGDFDSPL
jgi:hypothetical protein